MLNSSVRCIMSDMDVTNPRDRIWYQMIQTYRKGCYYSDLSFNLRRKYLWLSSIIVASPWLALALFQIDVSMEQWHTYKGWLVSFLLLVVALIEAYIAQTNLRGDISASRIMGVQFHKLAEKWRLLWIDQERDDIKEWIENLEDLTNHMAVEHLSARDDDLNEKCQEEANDTFNEQFLEEVASET